MKLSITFLFLGALLVLVLSQPPAQNTCSSTVPHFSTPTTNYNCEGFVNGNSYSYPSDFKYLNFHQWYECPTSGYRILTSNGIPNHDVKVQNPNDPCEVETMVYFPLNGSYSQTLTEPSNLGPIAYQLNGVVIYGAQENGGSNAVQPGSSGQVQDAQYWYGHTDQQHNWHYHNPFVGNEVQPGSTQLIAYSLDGFPIYGPVTNTSVLDSCNGQFVNGQYQYHVQTLDQVNGESTSYCNGTSPAIQWNYVLGCYHGSLSESKISEYEPSKIPSDCTKVDY